MSRKGAKKGTAADESSPSGNIILEEVLCVGSSLKSKSKKDWKARLICLRQRKENGYASLEVYRSHKIRPQFQTATTIPLCPELEVYFPFECPHSNVFVVEGPDDVVFLSARSEEQRTKWVNSIQRLELFKEEKLRGGELFDVVGEHSTNLEAINGTGDCILAVDCEHVLLAKRRSREMVVKWPLSCIRRYCCEHGKFILEAGRRSPRGPGEYTFLASDAEKIFHTLEAFIKEMAKNLSAKKESASSIEGGSVDPKTPTSLRPPAVIPAPIPISNQPENQIEYGSPGYLEIPSEGFQGATAPPLNSEYSRTVHNVGPQVEVSEPVPDGVYNTLQHAQDSKRQTWRSATVDSKAQYQVAKHATHMSQTEPVYNVAFTKSVSTQQQQQQQQQQQHIPSPEADMITQATAPNPTYQSTEVPQDRGKDGSRQFKSRLLQQKSEEDIASKRVERSYSAVKYSDKLKKKRQEAQDKKCFVVEDDEHEEESKDKEELTLSTSPPDLPPRRYNTKSECEALDLDTPPEPPPSRVYSKSECDELLLSTGEPPELPERPHMNSSDL